MSLPCRSVSLVQPKKRRRVADPGDEALISSLLEVTAYTKELKEKTTMKGKGPNMHFGMEVAERLNRLEPWQQAIAKVCIQQVLLDIEYPSPPTDYSSSYHPIPKHPSTPHSTL